jgi:hypothetical protein
MHAYLFFDILYVNLFRVLDVTKTNRVSHHHPTRNEKRNSWQVRTSDTYGTYSPSLFPTISSVIKISWYVFPLCTENRRPTKLGRIVAARFCVLIGGVPGGGGSVRGRGRLDSRTKSQYFCFQIISLGCKRPVFGGWWGIDYSEWGTYGTMFGPGWSC